MAILIMLNNYFHDLAVAFLFASYIMFYLMNKYKKFDKEFYLKLLDITRLCWVWIIFGGVIRLLAYRKYEWMESAGRGQILALIFKHCILVVIMIFGIISYTKLKKKIL